MIIQNNKGDDKDDDIRYAFDALCRP